MPGNPFSLTNPSGEVHSNNHTTPWPNYLTTAYALMFYNDRAVRELMSQKYELLVRNAFNLYLYHLALLGGGPEMTFTNYVLNSLGKLIYNCLNNNQYGCLFKELYLLRKNKCRFIPLLGCVSTRDV